MTNHWLPLCQNYPNMNLDLGEDSGDKFVTSLLAHIKSTLDTLTTNQIKSNLQEQLVVAIKEPSMTKLNNLNVDKLTPIFEHSFTEELKGEIEQMEGIKLLHFSRYVTERYRTY